VENRPFDIDRVKKWLPVNKYIGGAEHSVLHLLYSRFIWMALYDLGYFDFSAKGGPATGWEEPFSSFFAHGLIIKDGAKMSKSKGNVVIPDEYIDKYGADTLRTYLMFLGPFSDGGDFRDSGIEGMNRFIKRVLKKFENT
jgi:leucyl-tRNA synthetase